MGDETEFCQRIELDKQKLLDNELQKIEVDSFNLTEFWVQFESSVQSLSNEVTKIGFMCGKKPFPKREEVDGMMSELSQRYSEMRDLFLVLPEEVGNVVYKSAKDAVANIMSSLLAVVKSLKDLTEVGAKERLTLTGTFWDACNAVDKLPRNNLQACIAAVDAEQSLVNDAVEELKQVIEDDGVDTTGMRDNYEPWTQNERRLGDKATFLLRATQVCLARLHKALKEFGNVDSTRCITELDRMAEVVRTVSPSVDDVVCDLYHPVDYPTALDSVQTLVSNLHQLLSVAEGCHYAEGLSKNVISVLVRLVDSSHQDIKVVVDNPIPEMDNLAL